ncbi:hypothetical protein FIU83_06315 [Halomonas sp. THAF5a]|uniref:hypothetical protein n=1 Tax=Halomonas sp. THAF5a TaxID=2587844 RepID=UPI0012696644|nr:hypothetical protein [Halomonas sp. THAF5a]QFU01249.1 hypothetical protein FIU83_06315 [Halomonas sp. THAF5a]
MHTTRPSQARVYLHPAAATPQAVKRVELATGHLALPDPFTRHIRLLPLIEPARCLHQAQEVARG